MMSPSSKCTYYLDTSALVKRYLEEKGSSRVDELFSKAYAGSALLATSYWNIGEAVVVFNKYERRLGISARTLLALMAREARTLVRMQGLRLVPVSTSIIRDSINIILNYHIYLADAIQLVSARRAGCNVLVTADRELARVAEGEGVNTEVVG